MKKIHSTLTLLLLLIVCACSENTDTSNNNSPSISESARIAVDVGILVPEMEESLKFYRDQLGLEVIAEINTRLIGIGKMVQLKHGESIIKLVELEASPPDKSPIGINKALGLRYITLMVEDIAKYAKVVEDFNIPKALELTELGNGAQILMCEDPDGNIVEFVQEP